MPTEKRRTPMTSVNDLPPLALEVVHGFDTVEAVSELTRLLR